MRNPLPTRKPLTLAPRRAAIGLAVLSLSSSLALAQVQVSVSTTQQLLDAVANAVPNTVISIAPGTYDLPYSLNLKSGTSLLGAGAGQTVLRNAPSFQFAASSYYGADVNFDDPNNRPDAYLINLGRDRQDFSIRNLTLSGPQVYGGVYSVAVKNVTVSGVEFNNFRWSGIRSYISDNWNISNNRFIDAGGQTVNPDGTYGLTGGSMFNAYMGNSVINNNRIERSGTRPDNVFGIKGREFRNTTVSNNTVLTDFAIELPFENDYYVDIHNNYLDGVVSLPKYAGGDLPPTPPVGSGPTPRYTFKLKNNYFTKSYSIEGPHNGLIVTQNVFDFPVTSDYGNLYSAFDPLSDLPSTPGPYDFNNNIVINPGRGVFWSDVVSNNLSFRNNQILANEIIPSEFPEGLFGFRPSSPALGGLTTDFSTITIADNIIDVVGTPRSLLRNAESYTANIFNNQFTNLSDLSLITNPQTGNPQGLLSPLLFNVGVNGEYLIDGQALLSRAIPEPSALTLIPLAFLSLRRRCR